MKLRASSKESVLMTSKDVDGTKISAVGHT